MTSTQFRVVPLGGLGRVGGNLMVYESDTSMFIVDCGVLFPSDGEPGIDFIVPNVAYAVARAEKFCGYVITHAHEDHFGALPFIYPQLPGPIYANDITYAFIERRLRERGGISPQHHEIRDGEIFDVGEFKIEPIAMTHSIPGEVTLAMDTAVGKVIHTSDFKLDPNPVDGRLADEKRLQALGDQGIAVLLSDSTNAEGPGHTRSESEVAQALLECIQNAKQRVLVTTFPSNILRLQSIVNAAEACGRRVMPVGMSTDNAFTIGQNTSRLRVSPGTVASMDEFHDIEPHRLVIIASGSQGEGRAALSRIAHGTHTVKVQAGDTVVYSARRIPGNERAVGRVYNQLLRLGVHYIDERTSPVHASGHARQDELKQMISLCQPKYFIPIHGEFHQMLRHRQLAVEGGVPAANAFLLEDGFPALFEMRGGQVIGSPVDEVPAGHVYVDAFGVGKTGRDVLKTRHRLAQGGMLSCVATYCEGRLTAGPRVKNVGALSDKQFGELQGDIEEEVASSLRSANERANREELEEIMRLAVRRYFRRMFNQKPTVSTQVLEID